MSSQKLRKYLAYYRKTLNEDPENIEARLRLAALFREMGRSNYAIEEYGTAAKLLASDGLPLEAIAACKAILELDPSHQDTQLFLARLYAEVPEATGDSVRVARPIDPVDGELGAEGSDTVQESDDTDGSATITLATPKEEEGKPQPQDQPPEPIAIGEEDGDDEITQVERPTGVGPAPKAIDQQLPETTAVQPSYEQAKLRTEIAGDDLRETTEWQGDERETAEFDERDRETIELGVFDMDELGLDEASTGRWEDLDALDEFEEPDTTEILTDDEPQPPKTAQRQFRISSLPEIPLFSQLPRQVFVEVLDAMELQRFVAATEIVRPDDPASCLYIIVEGAVRVEKDLLNGRTVHLAKMGEGQVFGEFRLLTGQGGSARVVADNRVTVLAVKDEVIFRLGDEYPRLWEVLWDFYYQRMLNHCLASSTLFRSLTPQERELVAEHFERRELKSESVLFKRGDTVDATGVLVKGTVVVEVPHSEGEGEGGKVIDTLSEGAFVGVSPCAREMRATATVRAQTDVVFYRMEGEIFRELLYGLPEVAEAVRQLVDARLARTPDLPGTMATSERV